MKRIAIALGIILLIGLSACGQTKYRLVLDGYGFSSNYLDCDDAALDIDFEHEAYVIRFTMPPHDVTLSRSSRNTMVYMPEVTINLDNQVETADIWIMEDTPEKRKQSVWGDTTIKACAVNESLAVTLAFVSEDNRYIVRMIDDKGLYYEAYNVEITDGNTVAIKSEDNGLRTVVCIYDSEGKLINEYEMFVAAL